MNILFIGRFYPKKLYRIINEDTSSKINFSDHNFTLSLIRGLSSQHNIDLKVLTAPGVYSYPYNNKNLYTHAEKYLLNNVPISSIGFCNLFLLNKINITLKLIFKIITTLNKFKKGKIHIILSSPNIYLLLALFAAKKISFNKIDATLIVPDIPEFVSDMDKSNKIKSFIVSFMNKYSMKLAGNCQNHVLLTDQMKDFFPKKIKYIVMEGLVDVKTMKINENIKNSSNKDIILYTGTLRKMFGIMNLVEAFTSIIDNSMELWICGSGEASNEIEKLSKKNHDIKFFGFVDSKKALLLQNEASILINPRTSKGEYTKYSFPSKTMEYLLAGKPVIMNKLPGVPEEYYKYIFTPIDESVKALTDIIKKVHNMEIQDRNKIALEGRAFVLDKKNSIVQTNRIIQLIKDSDK